VVLEYLTTAFALADDHARQALADLLIDPGRGNFRDPYLRAGTPYRSTARWVGVVACLAVLRVPGRVRIRRRRSCSCRASARIPIWSA
jgi:hypothetical protein